MKILVLFSGTGSIEKVYDNTHDIRGLDFDNTFKPYYNVDILTWDYQTELQNWIPDYIHASPVCKEFSNLKNIRKNRDMDLGTSLATKSIEIIEYVKTLNPNLLFTIENPKGLMRNLDFIQPYTRITTSYCKYGFPYKKDTDFWYGGFELKLKDCCRNTKDPKHWCEDKKKYNTHRVRLGLAHLKDTGTYKRTNENQIGDGMYFKQLRKDNPELSHYTDTYFRYRIPPKLCEDIRDCVVESFSKLN